MNKFPYRKGVNILVLDEQNNYLLVQKTNFDSHQWGFPGGGSEEGDSPEDTVYRELKEELGSTEFEIIYKSPIKIKFDWPKLDQEMGFKKHGKWYQGQEKYWYVVKYTGNKDNFNLQEEEIKNIKWVPYEDLEKHLVFEGQWDNVNSVIKDYKKSNNL